MLGGMMTRPLVGPGFSMAGFEFVGHIEFGAMDRRRVLDPVNRDAGHGCLDSLGVDWSGWQQPAFLYPRLQISLET
ncbi:hypothetical protein CUR86_08430 [Salinicola acroporae]|uniref:Uncharacterized protein n=1 Tax=Salinicola acroporae TaxID=1541440 RepID=A0ABT6I491_9GAMM|nr:hypothetical protein [Salinicola acroporae]